MVTDLSFGQGLVGTTCLCSTQLSWEACSMRLGSSKGSLTARHEGGCTGEMPAAGAPRAPDSIPVVSGENSMTCWRTVICLPVLSTVFSWRPCSWPSSIQPQYAWASYVLPQGPQPAGPKREAGRGCVALCDLALKSRGITSSSFC